jgi:hypothetical protein
MYKAHRTKIDQKVFRFFQGLENILEKTRPNISNEYLTSNLVEKDSREGSSKLAA